MSNIRSDIKIEPEFNDLPKCCKTENSTLSLIKNEKPGVETIHGGVQRSEELSGSSDVYSMLNKIKNEPKEGETREEWNIGLQENDIKTEIKPEPESYEDEPSADLFYPEIIYCKSEKTDKDYFLNEEADQKCESCCTVETSCSTSVCGNKCSSMNCGKSRTDDPKIQHYIFPTNEDLSKNWVHNSGKKLSSWRCQYKDCETKKGDVGLKFYRFPCRDPKRFKQWIINCGNSALFDEEERKVKNFGICEKHFEEKDFVNKSHHRLTCIAVPKHFLTRPVQSHPGINTESTLSQSTPYHPTLSQSTPIYFALNQSSLIHFTLTQSEPTHCILNQLNQSRPTHFTRSRCTSNRFTSLLHSSDLTVIKPKYTYSSIRKKHAKAHTESQSSFLKSDQTVPDVP